MHVADDEEYKRYLLTKLVEESTELMNAVSVDHQKEEIADVREVLEAIQTALGFTEDELSKVQTSKAEERGGFAERIILDSLPE